MDYVKYIRSMVGHNKIILNASGAIIVDGSKILLQKRADNNCWGLFGGIMELDETHEECAIREIKEETGLDIKLDYLIGIYHNFDASWPNGDQAHCITAIYKASIISGDIRLDSESYEARWFDIDEIPFIASKENIQAISDYKAGFKNQIY